MASTSKAAPTLDGSAIKSPAAKSTPRAATRRLPGNQALLRLQRKGFAIQPKVAVGPVDDPFEREADAVAERVMRVSVSEGAALPSAPQLIQRASASREQDEEEAELQRNATSDLSPSEPHVQTKLAVSAPDDPYEREADQVAAQVVDASSPRSTPPLIQRDYVARQEDEQPIHRADTAPGVAVSSAVEDTIGRMRGGGAPLSDSARSFFEPRFGRDLGDVRIHTSEDAASAAQAISARAFTVGREIAFARGEFAPDRPDGRRLLAHELAHTVQQNGEPRGIQRKPSDPQPVQLMPDVTVTELPDKHQVVYAFHGKPWVTVTYRDRSNDRIDFITSGFKREQVVLTIKSSAKVDIAVDLDVERELTASRKSLDYSAIGYDFVFHGTVTVKNGALTQKMTAPLRRVVIDKTEYPVTIEGLPEPPTHRHEEHWLAGEMKDTYPSFKNRADLLKYLAAHPKDSFAIVRARDGRFIARPLTNDELHNIANNARAGNFNKRNLEDVDWYRNEYQRGEFQGVWVQGQEYDDLASMRDVFFSDPESARVSADGTDVECEIYEMSSPDTGLISYGRKRLSHDEALARWRQFDAMASEAVLKLETEPGHRFFALQARGVSTMHSIGRSYLAGRDGFRAKLASIDKSGTARDDSQISASYVDFRDYFDVEIDRSEDNPEFIDALKKYRGLTYLYGSLHYQEVVDAGQKWAADAFQKSAYDLRSFVEDDRKLTQWVLTCPQLPRQQLYQTLEHLDMMDDSLHWYNALAIPQEAIAVASGGVGNGFVTLERIREKVLVLAKKLDDARDSILKGDLIAIKQEGEFGDSVRLGVYKQYGYKLDPKAFPYKDKLPDSNAFGLEMMGGSRSSFVSVGEQMFATQLRRVIAEDNVWKWAKVIGLLVLTVILVVALNAAGAAIAGAFFAEGTLGSFAVSALVVGTGLTAIEWAQVKIGGGSMTWGELLEAELWNVATAGLLGRLGYAFKDASTLVRVGVVGSAAFGAGFARFVAQHKGPITSDELLEFFIENAVMFAAMEAAGSLARPMTQRAALWGRAQRLGVKVQEIANFRAKVNNYMRDLGGYKVRPGEAAREQAKIQQTGEQLLAEEEKLVKELNESLRTRGDAEQVQKETNEEIAYIKAALEGMEKANFLAELKLKPVGQSQSIFTFEAVPDAVKKVQDFFPGSRAEAQSDGTIRVYLPGSADPIILTPAGKTTAAPADPASKKVDINRATEADLATLPGIGKKLAKAIVEQRQKNGGRFGTVDDLARVPGIGPGTLAKVAPLVVVEDAPPLARQTELDTRLQALLKRADRLGYTDPTIEAIADRKVRPMQSTDPHTLDATEQKIAAAEKSAGAKMDAAAKRALANVAKRLGSNKVLLRTGALSGVSDEQVGDALSRVAGRKGLDVEQLRGIIWAHLKGVPIEKFMDMSEGFGTKARNRALEAFGQLADGNVRNCQRVLADMTSTPDDWMGGMFALEVARYGYGIDAVDAFEVRIEGGGYTRDIDIVLKNGLRLELKNWGSWEYRTSLANASNVKKPGQFLKDMAIEGFSPSALHKHRYIFRYPAPESLATIRAYLRSQLEIFMKGKVSANDAKILLDKFDATTDLVTVSKARAEGGIPDVPPIPPPLLVPTQPRKDTDTSVPAPISP